MRRDCYPEEQLLAALVQVMWLSNHFCCAYDMTHAAPVPSKCKIDFWLPSLNLGLNRFTSCNRRRWFLACVSRAPGLSCQRVVDSSCDCRPCPWRRGRHFTWGSLFDRRCQARSKECLVDEFRQLQAPFVLVQSIGPTASEAFSDTGTPESYQSVKQSAARLARFFQPAHQAGKRLALSCQVAPLV